MRIYLLLILFTSLFAEGETSKIELKITNHTITLDKGPISYIAITGKCPIVDEEYQGDLFFIAYEKQGEENRPITFFFPGGPGGAGTVEAILGLGPRRLLTAEEGRTIFPPYQLIDNPETLLESTDLVFVDPISCGFSKAQKEADFDRLYSVEGDILLLAQWIHTLIDYSGRWNSPIYLAGSSYGTVRCCGLAEHLLSCDIAVKGIILDGCAIEFSTIHSQRDKALADVLFIPTCAATAWYHGRLWPEKPLAEVIECAKHFAYNKYAPFLLQPNRLDPLEKNCFEIELAELMGLPLNIVRRYNLRINESIFCSEFFGPERKVLGGLDSRYVGDISTIDPGHSHDPSYLDTFGVLPAFRHYLKTELETHFPFEAYVLSSPKILHAWNFATQDSDGLPSFLQRLRHAMVINPLMNVFIGAGYFDCRTPFAATEYCFDHLDLPISYRKNIQFAYYEGGHGFIFDYPLLKKWKTDLSNFYGR